MSMSAVEPAEKPLWRPSPERIARSQVTAFIAEANKRHGLKLKDYRELHAWSVANEAEFWDLIWDFCGVVGDKGARRLIDGDKMPGAQFFPDAKLNFAENLLKAPGKGDALIFRGEDKVAYRLSWDELKALVSRLQQALKRRRRRRRRPRRGHDAEFAGDHRADAGGHFARRHLLLLLARFRRARRARPLRPDRAQGVRDGRRLLVQRQAAVDRRQGRSRRQATHHRGDGGDRALSRRCRQSRERKSRAHAALEDFLKAHAPKPLTFARLPFNHPVYILFSSGTTGVPKCIVHGAGGTLLQHMKEHRLQCDLRAGEHLFYFTTCGWMMWNWLASGIGSGATLVLFDGSPFAPQTVLFDLAQDERINVFGTSAKYIDACKKAEPGAGAHARSVFGAADHLDRLAARRRELRLRLFRHQGRTCISPRSPAAPTSSPVSCSAIRPRRCGAAKSRPPASAWRSTSGRRTASRCASRRANWSAPGPSPRCR